MQREIGQFFRSVSGARLLLAGSLDRDAATSLAAGVRRDLAPLLSASAAGSGGGAAAASPSTDDAAAVQAALRQWQGLLYKPSLASALSQNACLDPALARALDQCGSL